MPGVKVLLIDLDAQRNATGVMLKKTGYPSQETIFDIFSGNKLTSSHIHETDINNLFMIPASLQLVEVESMLANDLDGFFKLKDNLEMAQNEFDYIIIDCPPSLSVNTINALVFANHLIIPMQVSKFSIDGIQGILDAVRSVKKRYNPSLNILGALLAFHDPRTTLAQAMLPEIEKLMPVFKVKIPKSVAVEESHLLKKDLFDYAPKSKVTLAYKKFVEEVTGKNNL